MIAAEFQAKIHVDRGARLNRIRIQCNRDQQADVVREIYEIFREAEESVRTEEHATYVSQQVTCQFCN